MTNTFLILIINAIYVYNIKMINMTCFIIDSFTKLLIIQKNDFKF